jgi:hypothetical protein
MSNNIPVNPQFPNYNPIIFDGTKLSLQEKLFFATWFLTRFLVMEDIYDYMTM